MLLEEVELKFQCTLLWCKIVVFRVSFDLFFSPGAPTSDANTLENVDAELTDVDKEEHEEPEWAVTPADGDKKADIWTTRWWSVSSVHPKVDAFVSFTWTPHKVVCTSRQMNTAWRGWTRGWTSRSPPPALDPHRTRPCSPSCWRAAFLCELQHKEGTDISSTITVGMRILLSLAGVQDSYSSIITICSWSPAMVKSL